MPSEIPSQSGPPTSTSAPMTPVNEYSSSPSPSAESPIEPATAPPPGSRTTRVSTPHGRLLGIGAYALGIALAVVTYAWAYSSGFTGSAGPAGAMLTASTAVYSHWAVQRLLFILVILLMSFAGWLIAGRGAQLYLGAKSGNQAIPGALIGAIVFCGGIGLVVLVFLTARHYFGAGPDQVPAPSANPTVSTNYIAWMLGGVYQILLLGVMALSGSLIAGRGIVLFLGSIAHQQSRSPD
ncbi:MAG TPA: hypothetical protein VFJ58_14435 [Armatimonadota bacterium]|nr:hypothetical protein [Armatimonadota bacterium]